MASDTVTRELILEAGAAGYPVVVYLVVTVAVAAEGDHLETVEAPMAEPIIPVAEAPVAHQLGAEVPGAWVKGDRYIQAHSLTNS